MQNSKMMGQIWAQKSPRTGPLARLELSRAKVYVCKGEGRGKGEWAGWEGYGRPQALAKTGSEKGGPERKARGIGLRWI